MGHAQTINQAMEKTSEYKNPLSLTFKAMQKSPFYIVYMWVTFQQSSYAWRDHIKQVFSVRY